MRVLFVFGNIDVAFQGDELKDSDGIEAQVHHAARGLDKSVTAEALGWFVFLDKMTVFLDNS